MSIYRFNCQAIMLYIDAPLKFPDYNSVTDGYISYASVKHITGGRYTTLATKDICSNVTRKGA